VTGLVLLLDKVGWDTIGRAFVQVGPWGALLVLALGMCENLGDAASMRAAFGGKLKLSDVLSIQCAGALANDLLPMEAGEVLKATLFSTRVKVSEGIAGTVVWNYVFKFVRPLTALMAALVAMAIGVAVPASVGWTVVGASIAAFIPFAVLALIVRKGGAGLVTRLLHRLGLGGVDPQRRLTAAAGLDERIRSFRVSEPRKFRAVIVYQFLARLASLATHVAAIRLVGLGFDLSTCTLLYAAFSMAHYVVTLMPAKLGVGEGAGYIVFSLFGYDGGAGVVVYVVLRLRTAITNGLPALLLSVRLEITR